MKISSSGTPCALRKEKKVPFTSKMMSFSGGSLPTGARSRWTSDWMKSSMLTVLPDPGTPMIMKCCVAVFSEMSCKPQKTASFRGWTHEAVCPKVSGGGPLKNRFQAQDTPLEADGFPPVVGPDLGALTKMPFHWSFELSAMGQGKRPEKWFLLGPRWLGSS